MAVEDLRVGDRVITHDGDHGTGAVTRPGLTAMSAADGRMVTAGEHGGSEVTSASDEILAVVGRTRANAGPGEPIVWIGQRNVNCGRHPRPEAVWPVRVRAGALGPGRPVRDLFLPPTTRST